MNLENGLQVLGRVGVGRERPVGRSGRIGAAGTDLRGLTPRGRRHRRQTRHECQLQRPLHESSVACLLLGRRYEHGDRFDLHQQFGTAQNRLNSRGSRKRVESLLLEERRALLVERRVIALDVAQVARGPHDVFPGGAFGRQQAGDVVVGAPQLRAEVARRARVSPRSSMLAVPEISRMTSPFRSMRNPREKELGFS